MRAVVPRARREGATAAVKEAIVAAFHEVGGKDFLVEVARSDPKVFCTLLSKLVPAQVRAELENESRSGARG